MRVSGDFKFKRKRGESGHDYRGNRREKGDD